MHSSSALLLILAFVSGTTSQSSDYTWYTDVASRTPTSQTWPASTGAPPSGLNKDRSCACNLENLWLDVVAVVDNSQGMGKSGLIQVAADISSVFAQSAVGTTSNQPRSVRVGIVTYSEKATVVFDLNYFQSVDSLTENIYNYLSDVTTSSESNLKDGLTVAMNLLNNNRTNGYRSNYKRAMIVYASDYNQNGDDNPLTVAGGIKGSGINIITVAFNQGAGILDGLSKVASPGFSFNSQDLNLVGEIQDALCQTNCFCQVGWTQYRAVYGSPDSFKYGVCLSVADIDANWQSSKYSCQNQYQGAYLTTEFDQQKHNFNQKMFIALGNTQPPYAYHIGLSYSNGQYSWEQGQSQTKKPLSNQNWNGWNAGFPTTSNGNCVDNQQLGTANQIGWSNSDCYKVNRRYICESASCDTDKYCA